MTRKTKTWFITGAASGLGLAILRHVIGQGDDVIAAARDVDRIAYLKSSNGGDLTLVELDVGIEGDVRRVVAEALGKGRRIDVLVNNAGYGTLGSFEQTSSAAFREELNVNFLGTVSMIRATLPSMRQHRSGLIINISSSAGRVGHAGMAAYCAAKAAVGVFTEALAKETKPFGVKVISVEPGSIRTGWTRRAIVDCAPLLPEYEETVGASLGYASGIMGKEVGDPDKYAEIIFGLSARDELPEHLLLGPDAFAMVSAADRAREAAADTWESVSRSTNF